MVFISMSTAKTYGRRTGVFSKAPLDLNPHARRRARGAHETVVEVKGHTENSPIDTTRRASTKVSNNASE